MAPEQRDKIEEQCFKHIEDFIDKGDKAMNNFLDAIETILSQKKNFDLEIFPSGKKPEYVIQCEHDWEWLLDKKMMVCIKCREFKSITPP